MTTKQSEAGNGRDGSGGHFRLVIRPRRKHKDLSVAERVLTEGLRELIREGRAQLVGPVLRSYFQECAKNLAFEDYAIIFGRSTILSWR